MTTTYTTDGWIATYGRNGKHFEVRTNPSRGSGMSIATRIAMRSDANLISAAPDLLAALVNMLDDCDETDREQARAAIAKARGEG